MQGSCLRDDEGAAGSLVRRQRRQHDVRGVDEVGGGRATFTSALPFALQDDAVRIQREEVAVAVQRLIRRTAAALARREQLLVRDVLPVECVLLALQAAAAQGFAQGGGQSAERRLHPLRAPRDPPRGRSCRRSTQGLKKHGRHEARRGLKNTAGCNEPESSSESEKHAGLKTHERDGLYGHTKQGANTQGWVLNGRDTGTYDNRRDFSSFHPSPGRPHFRKSGPPVERRPFCEVKTFL